MARMDLITEPRQIVVRTLDVAICGTVNDTNSFWGLVPATGVRSQYTNWFAATSTAADGTRWKMNLRGAYEAHFFCFTLNESAEVTATVRAGHVLDPTVAAQQTDPSNATVGIYGLDAHVLPAIAAVGGASGSISMTAPIQIDDVRVGGAARGFLHVLLSNGAGGTPVGVVAAGAMLTITRTGDVMGSWV